MLADGIVANAAAAPMQFSLVAIENEIEYAARPKLAIPSSNQEIFLSKLTNLTSRKRLVLQDYSLFSDSMSKFAKERNDRTDPTSRECLSSVARTFCRIFEHIMNINAEQIFITSFQAVQAVNTT
jgi:hypothetical protein